MTANKKRKIYFYIFWPVLVISFTLAAFFVVLVANGYQLNQDTWKLEKTGTIILEGPTTGGDVNLDSLDKGGLPANFRFLSVGRHEIIVTKKKYQTWTKVFNVLPGRAILVNNLTLFYTEPVVSKVTNNLDRITVNTKNSAEIQKKDLEIKGNEVYYKGKLITRFSQPVLVAIYDTATDHLFVQIGNEIKAVNAVDLNQFNLIKLQKTDPTIFSVTGKNLYFFDGGELYQAEIR